MNWERKSALVTGAGGFMGSHLTERLVELGTRVRAFVRYNSRNDWGMLELLPKQKLDEIQVIAGDLKDIDAVRRATEGVEIVFHLGSLIAIPYSYVNARDTIETNVIGTSNIMIAAREAAVERVVHTSTSEVYGTAIYVPIDEKHPMQGQSPYAASKIGADAIAESFHRSFGLPVTTIRPFNFYGPRQSARAVIPTIMTQAMSTSPRIELGSLHPTRDYTYYTDVVAAFCNIVESERAIGEIVNIGSNFEISIGDLANKILSIMGIGKEICLDRRRVRPEKSEVERLWCENRKAKSLLGWQPKVGLEEGLQKTVDWVSANIDRYKANMFNI